MRLQLQKHHARYSRYKATKVPLLGDVPKEWSIQRLRFLLQLNPSKQPAVKLDENLPVSFIPMEAVSEDGDIQTGDIKPLKDVKDGYTYFQGNDVLMAKITPCFENGKGAIAKNLSNNIGFGSTEFLVMRCGERILPKLLWYFISSHLFRSTGEVEMRGSAGQKRVPERFVKDFQIGLPSKPDQHAMVDYLDTKSALVEKIIKAKQKQIELLKENRVSLISKAVTRGLNQNVEMKDSGIEWIGVIPKNWRVKKLKYVGAIVLGKMLQNESKREDNELKSYLRAQNIRWETVDVSDTNEMFISAYERRKYRLEKDDLLVSEGGEVGRTCIWKNELNECYIQNSVNRVRTYRGNCPLFFLYQFVGFGARNVFMENVNRVSIAHLTKEKLKEFPFTVPPLKEQERIANFIDAETKKIDEAVNLIEKSITLLKEYKSSLISNVVTGKIKVA